MPLARLDPDGPEPRHHTKVHHGFRIHRDPDGRWHTYRPNETEILIPPALRT